MEEYPYPGSRFVLNGRLAIEAQYRDAVVLYHIDTHRRLRLSTALFERLERFKEPQSLESVFGSEESGNITALITRLIDAEFLIDLNRMRVAAPRNEAYLDTVFPTMYRAPFRTPSQSPSDIGIFGVSFDGSNVVNPGARNGPRELRRRSCDQEYRVDAYAGKPLGWFEVDTRQRLLEGATIADWGDVPVRYGENPDWLFERVHAVTARILDDGAIPALLGGDHSVSYPAVKALQERRDIQVIWLDAHTDYGDLLPGVCNNHKNVVTRILELPGVREVINVGHRGYTAMDKTRSGRAKFSMITAEEVRSGGSSILSQHLHPGVACYVSMDIDVLDPIYAPGTSTPCPGGLTHREVKSLLREIGDHVEVAGCDLVEVNPSFDQTLLTVIHAHQLLTVCLGAAWRSRQRTTAAAECAMETA